MIDVKKLKYQFIGISEDGTQLDITGATEDQGWEEGEGELAMTERFTRLAYTTDIGTEMIDALAQEDREAVQSAIERTITEALMVNPKTEYVRGFAFTWESDSLFCTCVVKGQDWEEFSLAIPAEQEVNSIG